MRLEILFPFGLGCSHYVLVGLRLPDLSDGQPYSISGQ